MRKNLLTIAITLLCSFVFAQTTIYVKRQGSSSAPKIHVWTKATGTDVPVTNTSNWPNNLPTVSSDTNGWFKYSASTAPSQIGCLFVYNDKQTADFKYYSWSSIYVLLDSAGNQVSVTATNPDVVVTPDPVISVSQNIQPKANGKFDVGQTVTLTVSSENIVNRMVYYTTDGSDPKTSSTRKALSYNPEYAYINVNPRELPGTYNIRIIETNRIGQYPFSNEYNKTFTFEAVVVTPDPVISVSQNIQPKANGKFDEGQTVVLTISSSNETGRKLFYTTDGSDPRTSSTRTAITYTSGSETISVTSTKTVRIIETTSTGSTPYSNEYNKTFIFETVVTPTPTLWKENNNNIYYNDGNVGVGTSTPTAKLDIDGNIKLSTPGSAWLSGKTGTGGITSSTQLSSGYYHPYLRQKTLSGHVVNIGGYKDVFGFFGYNKDRTINGYDYSMVMDLTTGNIGIGKINPSERLDVYSGVSNKSGVRLSNLTSASPATANAKTIGVDNLGNIVTVDLPVVENSNVWEVSNGKVSLKNGTDFVGIGTNNPDEKLTVKGTIHAEELKIDLEGALADYVFENYYDGSSNLNENYTMLSLDEVEAFTKENKHLPNVPSAKDIKENGMKVGEMANILLQKIEELTLYTIEQKKEIEALKQEVLELKNNK
ncbi:MAG: chitobiase/beta-hexosaminidase C-terminal domain-containing protein [Flavobacteriales bacterium]|nr:chitobiase/beta-hexosaminidase C-terminal domain-containing protein [Flavobacteriales bacterium]